MVGTKGSGPKSKIDWSQVDWSIPDTQLGEQLGLTRQGVNHQRQQARQPPAGKRGWGDKQQERRAQIEQWLRQDPAASTADIAVACGVSAETVRNAKRRLGLVNLPQRTKYGHLREAMNWQLPNCDLERIWRLPSTYAGVFRYRWKKGPARWHRKSGILPQDPAYHQAIAQEKAKAIKQQLREAEEVGE